MLTVYHCITLQIKPTTHEYQTGIYTE